MYQYQKELVCNSSRSGIEQLYVKKLFLRGCGSLKACFNNMIFMLLTPCKGYSLVMKLMYSFDIIQTILHHVNVTS